MHFFMPFAFFGAAVVIVLKMISAIHEDDEKDS